ncbi:hypothetical protein RCL1_008502 [Eukaryota sp. TZLM3-RCL]
MSSEHAQLDAQHSKSSDLNLASPTFSHEGDSNGSSSFSRVDSRTSGTMASPTTTLGRTSPDYVSLDEAQLEVPSKRSIVEQLSKTIEAERLKNLQMTVLEPPTTIVYDVPAEFIKPKKFQTQPVPHALKPIDETNLGICSSPGKLG